MTEVEWLNPPRIDVFLDWLDAEGKPSLRKRQLYAIACCRRGWHAVVQADLEDEVEGFQGRKGGSSASLIAQCWDGILALERHLEGLATADEVATARESILELDRRNHGPFLSLPLGRATDAALSTLDGDSGLMFSVVDSDDPNDAIWIEQTFRCLLGNPFRPVAFSAEWRTSTAVALAQQMYESRDFSAMPILADALQDAGCESDDILNHCRDEKQPHVRGCWVVDHVLGKS